MVETPPNSSPSFLKKLSNKVIELLSLPLLYSPSFFKKLPKKVIELLSLSLLDSPSFFKLPNRPLVFKTMNFTVVDLQKMDCGIHVARI